MCPLETRKKMRWRVADMAIIGFLFVFLQFWFIVNLSHPVPDVVFTFFGSRWLRLANSRATRIVVDEVVCGSRIN